jgi:NADH dehydrogenase
MIAAVGALGRSGSGEPPHVVILGGGYVAAHLVRKLAGPIREHRLRATVVSRENFHAFHGFVGEMVTGRVVPGSILSSARRIFAPADFDLAEIEQVDLDARTVRVARRIDGQRHELRYDHLVIGLGTEDRTDAYPGLAEHAFRLRRYADCFALRNHVLEMLELAETEDDPHERRRLLTFMVAGGGFAGTEVAGEMADFLRRLAGKEYKRVRSEECRFVLVEPGPSILPELYGRDGSGPGSHPRLVAKAVERQHQLGVEVRTNTLVTGCSASEVSLSSGETIPTRTIISAVGTRPNPFVAELPLQKDARGRILTERTLAVPGHPGVWAAGDCAAVVDPKGQISPPVALYAMKHGDRIGANIVRGLDGKRPRKFGFRGLGQGASVGNRYAVAELYGIEIWGLLAWIVWRTLLTYYFPSWDRRMRLFADWVIWPIAGRDVVQMAVNRAEDFDLHPHVYLEGQTITTEGSEVRYIHVIVDGEVEIVELPAAGEARTVVRVLGPGDHFGIQWEESERQEAAIARTTARTIAVRRDQAPQLQQALAAAGPLRAESGHMPSIHLPPDEGA